jgi:DNA gyrase subunit A
MVQRTAVKGISLYGRASQGVNVMNLREDDQVSAVALVMEGATDTDAVVEEGPQTELEAEAAAPSEVYVEVDIEEEPEPEPEAEPEPEPDEEPDA